MEQHLSIIRVFGVCLYILSTLSFLALTRARVSHFVFRVFALLYTYFPSDNTFIIGISCKDVRTLHFSIGSDIAERRRMLEMLNTIAFPSKLKYVRREREEGVEGVGVC